MQTIRRAQPLTEGATRAQIIPQPPITASPLTVVRVISILAPGLSIQMRATQATHALTGRIAVALRTDPVGTTHGPLSRAARRLAILTSGPLSRAATHLAIPTSGLPFRAATHLAIPTSGLPFRAATHLAIPTSGPRSATVRRLAIPISAPDMVIAITTVTMKEATSPRGGGKHAILNATRAHLTTASNADPNIHACRVVRWCKAKARRIERASHGTGRVMNNLRAITNVLMPPTDPPAVPGIVQHIRSTQRVP